MKKREKTNHCQKNRRKKAEPALSDGTGAAYFEKSREKLPFFESLLIFIKSERAAEYIKDLPAGVFFGVLSFIFGRTPCLFDTFPLAIALLSAAENKVFYIFTGAVLSAVTMNAPAEIIFSLPVYITAYCSLMIIRVAARVLIDTPANFSFLALFKDREKRKSNLLSLYGELFKENVYLRMASACICSFFVSLYAMNMGEYRYYDLFSAMFYMVSAPAITYLFANFWAEREQGDKLGKALHFLSVAALFSAAVFGLKDAYVFGISLAAFSIFLVSLWLSFKKGIFSGVLAAFLGGIFFSPIYTPGFILAAISGGVLAKNKPVALSVSLGVAMLWGAYIDGFGSFGFLLPALLSASVILLASDSIAAIPFFGGSLVGNVSVRELCREPTLEENDRMAELSLSFSRLSKGLYELSDRIKKPSSCELGVLCMRAFEGCCSRCSKNDTCHMGEYGRFSEAVSKVTELLDRDGRVKGARLPPYIPDFCHNIDEIICEINTSYAELLKERLTGEKTELFALDYEGVSRIISEALEKNRQEGQPDIELTEKLRRADTGVGTLGVFGADRKRIYSRDIGKKAEKMSSSEIRKALEKAYGAPLSEPIFELRDGKICMRMEEEARFSVEYGACSMAKKGEKVCGDGTVFFEAPRGNSYAVLSDGMGSGHSAAFSSELCQIFLREMLTAGNRKETALKMLNNLLRSKGEESSAGVDLMELDLIHGTAAFLKSGAAPSFVRRGDKLYKLRSNSAPIGIMREIEAERLNFNVEDGDLIIMVSDGICQSPEENLRLMELLYGDINGDDVQSLAEKIIALSAEEGGGDDVSVILAKIKEKVRD